MPQNGLISPACAPQMVWDEVWKSAFLTRFRPIFGHKTAHLQGILGLLEEKMSHHHLKNNPKTLVLALHIV